MASRFYQKWYNRRRDPFTDQESPQSRQENGVTIPSSAPYQVQLTEVPLKEQPSSVSIYNVTRSQYMQEASTTPSENQFRVDYPAPDGEGTGLIEFNSNNAGEQINISYKGTGSPIVVEFLDGLSEEIETIKAWKANQEAAVGVQADISDKYHENLTERSKQDTDWVTMKEVKINESVYGGMTVSWQYKTSSSFHVAYTRVLVNGQQVGDTRWTTSESYISATQNVGPRQWQSGDLIQIQGKISTGTVSIKNMVVYYAWVLMSIFGMTLLTALRVVLTRTLSFTNQDPT